jgi:hypothetical protein
MTLQPVPSFSIPIDYYTDARCATWHMLRLFSIFLLDFQYIVRLLSRRYAPSKLRCDHRLSPRLHAHGCGPWRWTSDFVLIPHGDALPLHADDHHHEPSDSPASSHHDSDTHTDIEWYTTAAKSTITYQPIVSAIIDSSAWLTEVLFIAPPRFRVKAFIHPPRTFIYGLTALPSVCQSQPAASSSSRAANRPPRRMSSSGDPSSTI